MSPERAPREDGPPVSRPQRVRGAGRWWYLLLLLPFAATLVPPVYARETPMLGGWPFFYWWQFLWVIITAAILAFVYHVTTERRPVADAADAGQSQRGKGS